jgi:RNA polymerase sigma factor (TIGR02999 family)
MRQLPDRCPTTAKKTRSSIDTRVNDTKQLLEKIENGDDRAVDELLPVVYEQLRRLAHGQLAHEAPGQSLQTSDLVHEAYLRLVGSDQHWHGRGHFLAAAAEAMRRILVERARKKNRIKYGGHYARVELSDAAARLEPAPDEVIMVSELLDSLGKEHPLEAQVVKLHYFAGLSISEAGRALGLARSTAHRHWTFARAWLHEAIREQDGESTAS